MFSKFRASASIMGCLGISALLLNWVYYRQNHVVSEFAFVSGKGARVGSPLEGQVELVDVQPGQWVREGQVLVQFRQARQIAAVDQARAAEAEARASLEVARAALKASRLEAEARVIEREAQIAVYQAELRQATVRNRLAQRQAKRAQTLRRRGVSSRAELEVAQADQGGAQQAVERARSRLRLAKARLGRSQGEQARVAAEHSRVKLLEAGVETASAGVSKAIAELELTRIRAPRAGIVARALVGEGTAVRVGSELIELWYKGELEIEAWVDESTYGDLALGAPAEARLNGLSGTNLTGRVVALGIVTDSELRQASFSLPLAQSLSKSRWVRARIQLDAHEARLLPGLTARVSLPRGWSGPPVSAPAPNVPYETDAAQSRLDER